MGSPQGMQSFAPGWLLFYRAAYLQSKFHVNKGRVVPQHRWLVEFLKMCLLFRELSLQLHEGFFQEFLQTKSQA